MAKSSPPVFAPPAEDAEADTPVVKRDRLPKPYKRAKREATPVSYREGRQQLSAWVSTRAVRQFKAMAMEDGKLIQDAFVEMLNREFARKGRPEIAE